MDEEQRKHLYLTLLRGMANDIRNAPGSCDRIGHEWTEWKRTRLEKDQGPLRVAEVPIVMNESYRVVARRHCLQCGLNQQDG